MTAPPSIDLSGFLDEQLAQASPDLLREMLRTFAQALMGAEADAVCGAGYGQRSEERTNSRNGYRARRWDTRAGSIELAIPKLRQGSYFPDWLLERRRRAEAALVTVVATSYLLGVSTRRVEKLVAALGITGLSKSQVSEMAKELDAQVEAFRSRPLDGGPYTFVAADALTMKVREGGRVVKVAALVATGVNADGYREILGLRLHTAEDGAGWLAFFRDLVARGLSGVKLVTSDAHCGLVDAVGATLPGTSWQRCRTHFAANLMSHTPSTPGARSKRCCTRSMTSPTPTRCTPSSTGSWPTSPSNCLTWRTTSTPPEPTSWPSPASRKASGAKSGATTPTSGSTAKFGAVPTLWASSRPSLRDPADRCGARRAARRMGRITTLHRPGNPDQIPPHHNRRRNRAKHRKRPDNYRYQRLEYKHLRSNEPRVRTPPQRT